MEVLNGNNTQNYLLGVNNKFSLKANRILFLIVGICFFVQALYFIFYIDFNPFIAYGLGVLLLVMSSYNLLYSYYGFSSRSKYAARIELKEEGLLIKTGFISKSVVIPWPSVKKIELGNYSLGLLINNQMQYFNYRSNSATSIQIKRGVKSLAEKKGFQVNG